VFYLREAMLTMTMTLTLTLTIDSRQNPAANSSLI
jgi:hypothetical protein